MLHFFVGSRQALVGLLVVDSDSDVSLCIGDRSDRVILEAEVSLQPPFDLTGDHWTRPDVYTWLPQKLKKN